MGSMGWVRCTWCWEWVYNPYLPDGCVGALCDHCLEQWEQGARPPWRPDNLARMATFFLAFFWQKSAYARVRAELGHEISEHICSFLVRRDLP